jgi:arabinofuranosyltransferase
MYPVKFHLHQKSALEAPGDKMFRGAFLLLRGEFMERIQHDGHRILVALFISVFLIVLLRTAWMSDDAYITLRTVDNFVHGYGLTWNIAERVQAYTHPLWMFMLSGIYFVTREDYFSTIALSIVLSLATLIVLSRTIATSLSGALLGMSILLFSRAYIDYSTSGLENPLTNLLLVLFFALYLTRALSFTTLTLLAFLAALGVLNRMDTLLLFAPTLAYATLRLIPALKLRTFAALALGFAPFVLWELFSLWYYGFLFPNTAYAKLNTGIERSQLVEQGIYYLLNSVKYDPITLMATGCGIVLPFFTRKWYTLPIALGSMLYLIYIIRIGGDFMSGRFLAAPLVCAVVVITYSFATRALTYGALALGVVAIVGFIPENVTLLGGTRYSAAGQPNRIADESLSYYPSSGLLNAVHLHDMPRSDTDHFQREFYGRQASMETSIVIMNIGLVGFHAGPGVHIIDPFALSDPLLARLPATRSVRFRPGHFSRQIPAGYIETLESGENQIEDESLARYYEHLTTVTRGPLFDLGRLGEIWKFNTGAYDSLIDGDAYRYPTLDTVQLTEMHEPNQPPRNLTESGIEIDLGGQYTKPYLEVELSQNDDFELRYFNGETEVARQPVEASQLSPTTLAHLVLDVPPEAVARGYTRLHVLPLLRRGAVWKIGTARLLDSRDEMSPHIVLGWGWEPSHSGKRWARSPASVHLFAPHPLPTQLEIDFEHVYDPGSSATPPVGEYGVLEIYEGETLLRSVPVNTNEVIRLPVHLTNGQRTLSFRLQAGNFPHNNRAHSFAIRSMKLQVPDQGVLPADIRINGEQQSEGNGESLIASYGNNWYTREPEARLRWAQAPANILVYSPSAQWVELRLTPAALHDADALDGIGYQGILHITTNGEQPREGVAVVGQPLVTAIRLEAGINQVTLNWEDGNFRPSALDANNPDERLLSFAIEQIEFRTR